MEKHSLKALIVEDNENDAIMTVHGLEKGGYDCDYLRVEALQDVRSALISDIWDVIISDYSLDDFEGPDILDLLKELELDIPFIIISGAIGEETAVDAMRRGAHDYIMKDNLARLVPAVEREVREAENRLAKKRADLMMLQINEEMKKANDKLKTLDDLKTNLLANVSHELRTPLVSIKGFVELLVSGESGALSDEQLDQLKIVNRNTNKLLELINNLLDYTRMGFGKESLKLSNVDIRQKIIEVVGDFKPRCSKKNVTITVKAKNEPFMVQAEYTQFNQVITNLLDNALKFSFQDGNIEIVLERQGDKVLISMIDDGVGIPDGKLDQIFDKFYQADGSSSRRFGGVGLGLAICKEIVRMHNGTISAESVEGKGSCFTVELNVSEGDGTTEKKIKEKTDDAKKASKNILIVDDNKDFIEYLGVLLKYEKFNPLLADTGEKALAVAENEIVDVAILDVAMDGMDGIELCTRLKSDAKYGEFPVIMASAYSTEELKRLSEEAGATGFINKPFSISDLIEKVSENTV